MMDQLPAAVSFGENQTIHSQCTLPNQGSFTQSGGLPQGGGPSLIFFKELY